jgi:hypothetical protein
MVAAAAAAAAVFGLREDKEEVASDSEEDLEDPAGWEEDSDPEFDGDDEAPLDADEIRCLMEDFRNSLQHVFGHTALSADAVQDKLCLNEPVDLLQTWDSDAAVEWLATTSSVALTTMP